MTSPSASTRLGTYESSCSTSSVWQRCPERVPIYHRQFSQEFGYFNAQGTSSSHADLHPLFIGRALLEFHVGPLFVAGPQWSLRNRYPDPFVSDVGGLIAYNPFTTLTHQAIGRCTSPWEGPPSKPAPSLQPSSKPSENLLFPYLLDVCTLGFPFFLLSTG